MVRERSRASAGRTRIAPENRWPPRAAAPPATRHPRLARRRRHGFEVPHASSPVPGAPGAAARRRGGSAAADWPSLLAQARSKRYRTGAALPPLWTAAVRAGVPTAHPGGRGAAPAARRGARRAPGAVRAAAPRGAGAGAEVADQIQRDLPAPSRAPAADAAFLGQLRNVLLAYAARNRSPTARVNFVAAAVLLFVDDDADAFWLLAVIVEEVLVDHYVQSMLGRQVDQQVRDARTAAARGHSTRAPHPPFLLPFAGARAAGRLQLPAVAPPPPRPRPLDALRHPSGSSLFLNAAPPGTAFRVWDLILCHHPASLFLAALALLAQCESNSFLEATEVGAAVYLLRSSSRSAFDADGLVAATTTFPVSVDEIERLRRGGAANDGGDERAARGARAGRGAGSASTWPRPGALAPPRAGNRRRRRPHRRRGRAVGGAGEVLPQHECATLLDLSGRRRAATPTRRRWRSRRAARTWWRSPSSATTRRRSDCLCAQAFDAAPRAPLARRTPRSVPHGVSCVLRLAAAPAEVEALCDAVLGARRRRVAAVAHRADGAAGVRRAPPLISREGSRRSPSASPHCPSRCTRRASSAPPTAPPPRRPPRLLFETFMPLLLPMCAIRRKPPRATPPPPASARRAAAKLAAAQVGGVDGGDRRRADERSRRRRAGDDEGHSRAIRWAATLRTRTRWRWRWGSAGSSHPAEACDWDRLRRAT